MSQTKTASELPLAQKLQVTDNLIITGGGGMSRLPAEALRASVQGGEFLYAAFNTAVWAQGLDDSQTTFYLCELGEGQSQTIEIMLTGTSEPAANDVVMTLKPAAENVRITAGAIINEELQAADLEIKGRLGLYRLTGWREPQNQLTYWNVTLVDGVLPATSREQRPITHLNPPMPDSIWGFIH